MKRLALVALATGFLLTQSAKPQGKPRPPKSLRLYVFDCGSITMNNPALFGFTKDEVGEKQIFAVPCYLVVHPKGTLMWDVGVIPDAQINGPTTQGVSTATKTLKSQMAEIGYAASDIKYFAMSHMHSDHTANANDFAGATWLVHQNEKDAMFAPVTPAPPGQPRGPQQQSFYSKLKDSKTIILTEKDYDVFGDGTVVIMSAPGHTPGHQMLFLRLKESGPILIAGDLYHLPQEMYMHRAPSFDFNKDQTFASREKTEEFVRKTGARLWIEHDPVAFTVSRKSPAFYE